MENKLNYKPYMEISAREELERYETILDSYLEKKINKRTGELIITTPKFFSDKNIDYISEVISNLKIWINLPTYKEQDIERIYSKAHFLEDQIDFYKRKFSSLSRFQLASYSKLLNILEKDLQ